ncbi:aryl-sulfate sulfotransferase [Muriicola sp.]|uniref:aryl-sulfate sulfotransferase n=1 Tax=Muriicola sp. TaxID=2020856 RepID=UPI003C76067E
MRTVFCILILLGFLILPSCAKEEAPILPEEEVVVEDPGIEEPADPMEEPPVYMGEIQTLNANLVYDGLILVNDAGNNRAFLMDKEAKLVHEWPLSNKLGNDAFLEADGRLLASLETDDPKITLGGQGGILQFIAADGSIEWNFNYSSEAAETHHDAELLPNGNVLAMVWERRTQEVAANAGSNSQVDIFPEAIIEVDPNTDEIVWEWHAWDHIIQDYDITKDNFGDVAANPQLIDLNYVTIANGDIMHANGLAYDAVKDVIYLSVNFFHEVWVIDHSTSTEEASGSEGGNYGKGGDLLYRFGNPQAYKNTAGERLFRNNHFPNLLQDDHLGNMLIFTNGAELEQSTVYELQLPDVFSLEPNTDNEPEVVWSFTDPDLYAPKVSGAVLLPNGNRMIAEGDYGIWEVTEAGEVVWKFSAPGFFWRAYHYDNDAPEIMALGL